MKNLIYARVFYVFLVCQTIGFYGYFSQKAEGQDLTKQATTPQLNQIPVQKETLTPKNLSVPASRALTPDLVVQDIKVPSPPKAGDKIQNTATIVITNMGQVPSGACQALINCEPVDKKIKLAQTAMAKGNRVSIPALRPGQTHMLQWPSQTLGTWTAGEYRIRVEADVSGQVVESVETNNTLQLVFKVTANTSAGHKEKLMLKQTPQSTPQKEISLVNEKGQQGTWINLSATPNTSVGTGRRQITSADFAAVPKAGIGTGKREITGADFTAVPKAGIGTGKREITGADFTAVPKAGIGTGKREITGADFTAVPKAGIGTGKREITGADFTAQSIENQ